MLVYKKLEPSDEDILTYFYETYLNSGPSIREHVRTGLAAEGFVGYKCIDSQTERVVGAISVRPGVEFTVDHPELVEMVEERWGTEGLYSSDLMVVEPEYRKHGVGQQLAVLLQEGMREKHAVCLVMELWLRHKEGDVPALHSLQNAWKDVNIINLGVVENFYKNLADYGMTCPECGSDCKCGALICALEF